jgi:hypothetical protein
MRQFDQISCWTFDLSLPSAMSRALRRWRKTASGTAGVEAAAGRARACVLNPRFGRAIKPAVTQQVSWRSAAANTLGCQLRTQCSNVGTSRESSTRSADFGLNETAQVQLPCQRTAM